MALFKNSREKKLAAVLAIVLAALGAMAGLRALYDFRQDLQARIAQVENEELEAESWIGEAEFWRSKGEWLAAKQPKMGEPRGESLELLQKIESSARTRGLEVTGRVIKDVIGTPQLSGTPIRVELAGKFENLFVWLHELQQPENFILINELVLKPSSKTDVLDCSIEIMRCYQPLIQGEES